MKSIAIAMFAALAMAATPAASVEFCLKKKERCTHGVSYCRPGSYYHEVVCDSGDVALTYGGIVVVGAAAIFLLSAANTGGKSSHIQPIVDMTYTGDIRYGLQASFTEHCSASFYQDLETDLTGAKFEIRW